MGTYRTLENRMGNIAAWLVGIILSIIVGAPFVVHVVATVKANWAAMLIIGLVVPPVGWLHGVGIIFGWW